MLARCFQLHDAVAVLELDRVLDAAPEELDRHRIGLKAARQDRLELISQATARLLERMNAAAAKANSKVLLNPIQSPAVVEASNRVSTGVHDFHGLLGIESDGQSSQARRWRDAASERVDKTRETGAVGVNALKGFGRETRSQAKSVRGKLAVKISERGAGRDPGDIDTENAEQQG